LALCWPTLVSLSQLWFGDAGFEVGDAAVGDAVVPLAARSGCGSQWQYLNRIRPAHL
jgi:hypothetical protein